MPSPPRLAWSVATALGGAGLAVAVATRVVAAAGEHGVVGGLTWVALGIGPLFGVAVWLAHRRPEHPQARRMLLMSTALAVNAGLEVPIRQALAAHGPGRWFWAVNLLYQYTGLVSLVAAVLLLASFPDGVVERPWQARVLRLVWWHLALPPLLLLTRHDLVVDPYLLDPPPVVPSPFTVSWLVPLGGPLESVYLSYYGALALVSVLFVRYVQAEPAQRARMRLLLVTTIGLVVAFGLSVAVEDRFPVPPWWVQAIRAASVVFLLMVPVSVVVGIVRHRLYDIDLVVRRSVAFGLLSLAIAALYFGLSAAPGLALGDQVPVELAVVLTIGAAAAFQPVRRWLERLADRLVFGERVTRYELVTRFGAALEQTVELGELLPRLAETVHTGLGAEWVRVELPSAHAVAGEPSGRADLVVPLERAGEQIGRIECGPKRGGYQPADRELLATLTAQAATAIANVQLTARLAEQVDELALSRARIIAAGDQERRRIERDIHDGAQQQIVALIMKMRLARNQLGRGERTADDVLEELRADTRELLTDLRELAHGIHPPVLGDRGLVAAVEARADRLPLAVTVRAAPGLRERRLGPDVEGAAYFVVCEALTNVVKHSAASAASVNLSTVDDYLEVEVRDAGVGLDGGGGQGLTNLRDRVESLGGRLSVSGAAGTGTTVRAELPVGAGRG
ncbi:sensor histidine kinase [Saccharothrix variisporea]|uniref:sensor histidine kinase n=1 Tax=Saccharothrix variisporea TaxID=543527 RepID=UPI0011C35396|nr:histidine kinase [Saccharothrix variisporea]